MEKLEDGDFMGEMKTNVFDDRIFVFTPKGAVINLPRDATPVDFAYAVHSDLGNRLVIAKVNDKVGPLDAVLHNGDRIEIVTDINKRPSVAWLSFVKTSKAKEVIRAEINKEQREVLIIKGRMILSEYLEKHYGKGLDKELSILKNVDGRVLDTKGKEDILLQIGNLSRKASSLVKVLSGVLPTPLIRVTNITPTHKKSTESAEHAALMLKEEIIIGGQSHIPHKLALCCDPKPGERIVGYVTRTGVNIHKVTCASVRKGSLDRLIPANWGNMPKLSTRMKLEVLVENRIGVLRALSDVFYNMMINIEEIAQKSEAQ